MITIFTPTYNRAYILANLYKSLCRQTCKDFEWLIIDDGSTDNTESLVNGFIEENRIDIRYIKQPNGGKHRAINRGVQLANGELFFIVDSDDYLSGDAVEQINYHYNSIKGNNDFAGLSGVCAYPNGEKVGGEVDFSVIDCNLIDFRYKHHVKGDLAEIYFTDILKKYPFPEIEGEKFCPEALVWYRIAKNYKLRFFNEKIYCCDYLDDGLSKHILKHRMNSPVSALMAYKEVWDSSVPLMLRLKAAISYWRFYFYSSEPLSASLSSIGLFGALLLPAGYLLHLLGKAHD